MTTSTPTPLRYDAIVVGTGQAAPPLAVRLAQQGWKTAVVERGELGGTCVNNGCTPTKTLVASARVAHLARRAADFGVTLPGPVAIDYAKVRERMLAVVQQSRDGLGDWIGRTEHLTLVRGEARFLGADTLRVGDQVLAAPRIFLNTGARPIVPELIAAAGVPYLTSESIPGLTELPAQLVILGAGYIALEYAQVYRRFGAEVTVVEHGARLLPREDEDVAHTMRELLEREGIVFHVGADATAFEADGAGVALTITDRAGVATRLAGSHLLVATGRMPNCEALDLPAAGVLCDEHGHIPVDEQLRTNVPGIWALGDVNGRGAFTHTSYNDYEIVVANLFDHDPRRVDDRIPAYAVFTDPPLARIGINKDAARKLGRPVLLAHMPMTRVGRARERDETDGFMEVLVDEASKKILGATLFGIEADEAIHALLDVMAAGLPYTTIARTMHIHPTVSELIPTMLGTVKPLE